MLGDYSEFENICKVLVCNELVKCLFGICLMMFQHVSHSSCARHLKNASQIAERYFSFSYSVFWFGTCKSFICGKIKIYCAMFGVIIFLVLCLNVLGTMAGGNSKWGE